MPRKEPTHSGGKAQSKAPPVEQYRKNIGRQNMKVAKREMKAMRKRAEAKKSAMTMQEIVLMLVAFLVIVIGIYLFLYVYLSPDEQLTAEKMAEGDNKSEL